MTDLYDSITQVKKTSNFIGTEVSKLSQI